MATNSGININKLFKMESLMKDVFTVAFTEKVCSCVRELKNTDSTFTNNERVMASIIKEAVTIPPERR